MLPTVYGSSNENVTERGTVGEPEPMTLAERYKYLRLLQPSYLAGGRRQRGDLLDEAERATGRHRKSLSRLLRGNLERRPRSRQRGRSYGPQVGYAVRLVARTLDYPCAERLQPALVSTASSLVRHGELQLSAEILESLERISVSTVGRMVRRTLAPAQVQVCAATVSSPVWLGPALQHPTS